MTLEQQKKFLLTQHGKLDKMLFSIIAKFDSESPRIQSYVDSATERLEQALDDIEDALDYCNKELEKENR